MLGWRKDDEDPFAALKDGGTYKSAPTTVPDIGVGMGAESHASQAAPSPSAASPSAASPPAGSAPTAAAFAGTGQNVGPASAPTMRVPQTSSLGSAFSFGAGRRSRSFGLGASVLVRLVFAAIVAVAIAIPLLSIGSTVHHISIPSLNFGSSTPSPGSPSPVPPRRVSYLNPAGVRAGIAHLERVVPGARVVLFRIDSKSLSATAVGRHGVKEVYFGPTATLVTSAPLPGERPVPLSQVRPVVVGRLVAYMAHRFHVPARRIDYMVISSPTGLPAQWIVFSKAPSHPGFAATLSGAGLHRL